MTDSRQLVKLATLNRPDPMLEQSTGRECGDCRLCCKLLEVRSIAKPPARWCSFACDAGCRAYVLRPAECGTFICSWLEGFGLDHHRPDRAKVVTTAEDIEGAPDVDQAAFAAMGAFGPMFLIYEDQPGISRTNKRAREVREKLLELGPPVCTIPPHGTRRLKVKGHATEYYLLRPGERTGQEWTCECGAEYYEDLPGCPKCQRPRGSDEGGGAGGKGSRVATGESSPALDFSDAHSWSDEIADREDEIAERQIRRERH